MAKTRKRYSDIGVPTPATSNSAVATEKSDTSLNSHVEDYLLSYINREFPPKFAILLKGLWGTGKTWFIEDFLNRRALRERALFISLYGVTSFSDIEAEWFRQLHPFLSSKGMMLAGRILKGALKTGIKVDLGEGKEGSAESSFPDLKLHEMMTRSPRSILVFDDLERCSICVSDVLGYINQLVEKGDYRAIILANEVEIAAGQDQEEERLEYERMKEKLIGKTFAIRSEANSAIKAFLKEIKDSRSQHAIERSLDDIQRIYEKSNTDNLRHIRQMLLDIDLIIPTLTVKILGKSELVAHFLALYLIYSMEIRSKTISASDIATSYQAYLLKNIKRNSQDSPPKFLAVVNKYADYRLDEILLDASLWKKLIEDGLDVSTEINEALLNSSYFQNEDRPAWVKLWHHSTLDDDEADEIISQVANDFEQFATDDLSVIRHMFGLLLTFSKDGIYSKSTDDLMRQARRYIDHLKACRKLPLGKANVIGSFGNVSAYGLGFSGHDLPEFHEFNQYISQRAEEALEEDLPAQIEKLLEETLENSMSFYHALVLSGATDHRYHDIPILKYITPQRLFNVILQLNGNGRMNICRAIDERYRDERIAEILAPEKPVLESVARLLQIEGKDRSGRLSSKGLLRLSESFSAAANALSLKTAK